VLIRWNYVAVPGNQWNWTLFMARSFAKTNHASPAGGEAWVGCVIIMMMALLFGSTFRDSRSLRASVSQF